MAQPSLEEGSLPPGQAGLLWAELWSGGGGAVGDGGAGGCSPVVQHVVDQVDEVQPQLEVRPVGCDAVAEVARHQFAVRRGLGIAEHPVLPGLQQPGQWVKWGQLPQV